MRTAYVGLGSNVGDRLGYLRRAVAELSSHSLVEFVAASSVYATDPVGPPQPDYLNAVVEVRTSLQPLQLLALCKSIEREVGRMSRGRWQQREVDLDLLLVEGQTEQGAELTLPHPEMQDRAFVLVPLSDLDPGLVLPSGSPILRRLEEIGRSGVKLAHPPESLWPRP
ncbi:MAG TPA: 2-amino-4-hydroxy-6-hydroxymethyldihydropteridine diphosphokinase [Actinomycetota bacterium]|nr:2-amino-4-hydroxy-6-hydroxymethyldihydropteridine diphosphokinase [Actinomycetota bacterium]